MTPSKDDPLQAAIEKLKVLATKAAQPVGNMAAHDVVVRQFTTLMEFRNALSPDLILKLIASYEALTAPRAAADTEQKAFDPVIVAAYQRDVEKAVEAAKRWQADIPELTDHSPCNAIDTLAFLVLEARAALSQPAKNQESQPIGTIEHNQVDGWYFAPSVDWLTIGLGTKLFAAPRADRKRDGVPTLFACKRVDGSGYGSWLHSSKEAAERKLSQNGPAAPKYTIVGLVELDSNNNTPAPVSAEPNEWEEAQRICNLPRVDEMIRGFVEDQTGDNATMIVREVMRALTARHRAAADTGEHEDEYMCPNCVTPWKCNGPHTPQSKT